jgi:deoxyribodipyrimidine photo-lyase
MTDLSTTMLPTPPIGRPAAEQYAAEQLAGLFCDDPIGSERFRGGQTAADDALSRFDVARYASRRNDVLPESRRGASGLSPYIRHGLLPLRRVWNHVGGGPGKDVSKFRDELLWQEFSRHWYARLGVKTQRGVRRELPDSSTRIAADDGWNRDMACIEATLSELERDGWLVNQTRMWLSSDWSVRNGHRWRDGEDVFFTHLLDGSRAANRLGWQWTTGVGSSKHYGFSRWQVENRASELCRSCALSAACPIQEWPSDPAFVAVDHTSADQLVDGDRAGPAQVDRRGSAGKVDAVWLTAESLGAADPALAAHRDVPVVFTFDRALLERLQLSAKRLVFVVETLAEIATNRIVEVYLGDPVDAIGARTVAVTHAPVPGFEVLARRVDKIETHPWPWLSRPSAKASVSSFSSWRRTVRID